MEKFHSRYLEMLAAGGDRTTPPASPCNSICQLDRHNTCIGCGRTLAEIAHWGRMHSAEQWAVVERLAHRKEAG
jgi:uncharacterized protein